MKAPKEELVSALERGNYVLFLGAGAGIEAGLPDWRTSFCELADELEGRNASYSASMRGDAENGRFLEAAELLFLADLTTEERCNCLQSVFGKKPVVTKRLCSLVRLPYRSIVTTNFDVSLLKAATKAQVPLTCYTESRDDLASARTSRDRYILRLHGRVESPATMVFALRHYDALKQDPQYANFVESLLADSTIVFFGFSFDDPHLLAVLRNFSEVTRGRMRHQGFALLSGPPKGDLRTVLDKLNILAITYSGKDGHREGWDLLLARRSAPAPTPGNPSAARLQSLLAATLTHLRIKDDAELSTTVFAAAVLAQLKQRDSAPDVPTLVESIRKSLALPVTSANLVRDAIATLLRQGTLSLNDGRVVTRSSDEGETAAGDLSRLVDCVIARAKARYGLTVAPQVGHRAALEEVLLRVFVADGLALAHSLVGTRTERASEEQIEDLLSAALTMLPPTERASIEPMRPAILSLLDRPGKDEELLLDRLASTSFTLCLTLSDPGLVDLANTSARTTSYLDASVILPWLSVGHPTASVSASIVNYVGKPTVPVFYVNEIVSHRELALREFEEAGLNDGRRFRDYAMYYGLQNINAFIGGYAARVAQNAQVAFPAYLQEVAPFETEDEASALLEKKGLAVEAPKYDSAHFAYFRDGLYTRLESIGRSRNRLRVDHDAKMLAALVGNENRGTTVVSADRLMLFVLANSDYSAGVRRFLLPYQAAALAELRAGGRRAIKGLSRTVFSIPRSEIDMLREFYTSRVLAEYEPALLRDLPTLVEDIVAEAERQQRLFGKLPASSDDDVLERTRRFTALDQFESRFHESMLEAKKQLGLD